MESPGHWGQSLDDALPTTTAFVAPGQDLFMLQASDAKRHFHGQGGGSAPASPGHPNSTWPGSSILTFYPGLADPARQSQHLASSPQQPSPSQNAAVQHARDMWPYGHPTSQPYHSMPPTQQLTQGLAALDLAGPGGSPSPSRSGLARGPPPGLQSSPTAGSIKGFHHVAGGQWPHPQQYQLYQQQQQPLQQRGGHLAAAAAAADTGAGDNSYYRQHQQPQRHVDSGLRASLADAGGLYAQPGPSSAQGLPHPQQQQASWGGAAGAAGEDVRELSLRGPDFGQQGWGAANGAAAPYPPPAGFAASSPTPNCTDSGPAPAPPRSPQSPFPAARYGFPAVTETGGQHGAVRHVTEELRTSPLHPSAAFETPGGGGGAAGARGGLATRREQAEGGSSDKGVTAQRYQAQILALERHNAELQRRLADLQGALEAAQQSRQALEARQDDLVDQAAQANGNAKAREAALETARRANDALSGELRACQEELAAARDAVAACKDTAVQWQDNAREAGKELEAARKKIEALCEDERRLSAENMALRKEVQQLNDAIIKGRIETSELREKLRLAQQDTARAASTAHALASRAESNQEGAAAQIAAMRNRIVELESRNGQLQYDLAGLREEAAMARQAAEAAKAALAARPAGIMSDLDPAARQYGTLTQAWLAPSSAAAPGRQSLPSPPGAHSQPEAATAAAVLHNLPPNVAYSQLDPDTFRSMVRAEAAALARAGSDAAAGPSGSAHAQGGAAPSPQYPPYSSRYGGGVGSGLAAEPSSSSSMVAALPPPSSQPYWASSAAAYDSRAYDAKRPAGQPESPSRYGGPGGVRESLQALLPDPRASWAAPFSHQQQQAPSQGAPQGGGGYGGGAGRYGPSRDEPVPSGAAAAAGTGSASSPPPPYATYTDGSYAFRRPPNAVGAGAAAAGKPGTPFGTEETAKDMLARSKALEDQLMVLCAEKGGLEAEYARMPIGAGRSLRERNRKAVVEQRLELLNKEISSVRMQLKRLGLK